jgi:hypothetical protein
VRFAIGVAFPFDRILETLNDSVVRLRCDMNQQGDQPALKSPVSGKPSRNSTRRLPIVQNCSDSATFLPAATHASPGAESTRSDWVRTGRITERSGPDCPAAIRQNRQRQLQSAQPRLTVRTDSAGRHDPGPEQPIEPGRFSASASPELRGADPRR